ncbi:hypothetical protein VTK73DRAFT_4612 [Phialemonium thermophilum]|uniref:Uncharacterized protein n=1 Tax=Phialemonium thermophilum TaxID=223376 RepID=A0ABR3WT43_9PEZI
MSDPLISSSSPGTSRPTHQCDPPRRCTNFPIFNPGLLPCPVVQGPAQLSSKPWLDLFVRLPPIDQSQHSGRPSLVSLGPVLPLPLSSPFRPS